MTHLVAASSLSPSSVPLHWSSSLVFQFLRAEEMPLGVTLTAEDESAIRRAIKEARKDESVTTLPDLIRRLKLSPTQRVRDFAEICSPLSDAHAVLELRDPRFSNNIVAGKTTATEKVFAVFTTMVGAAGFFVSESLRAVAAPLLTVTTAWLAVICWPVIPALFSRRDASGMMADLAVARDAVLSRWHFFYGLQWVTGSLWLAATVGLISWWLRRPCEMNRR